MEKIEDLSENLQILTIQFEQLNSNILSNRISISSYQDMLKSITNDLEKNKAALKLRDLGATFHLKVAKDKCPTCFQNIVDNLLAEEIKGPQMDLKAQIEYLKSQKRMLEKQIEGITKENTELGIKINNTKKEISKNHDDINSFRKSIFSGTELEKLYVRKQVYIENEVRDLSNFKESFSEKKEELKIIMEKFLNLSKKLEKLPKEIYTEQDIKKIKLFEHYFKDNSHKFHYESAPISSISMSRDNLLPSLAHMELREIRKSNTKTDSSASDFVRLIWSYIISLFQASNISPMGNHLNFLLLDEPGQHSMAQQSQRALLSELSQNKNLQSIVAASFDESESIFHEVTHGIDFKLIYWEGKLIKPM